MLRALGMRVRELRAAKGWSQEQLADEARIDRSYMSGIERGVRNPTVLSLARVAGALGVTLADLLAAGSAKRVARPVARD
jgi:transcriptional regulator with XRE-family HTH domain